MEMKGDNDLDQVDLDKETVKDEEKEKGEKEEGGGGGRIKKKTEVKPDGEGFWRRKDGVYVRKDTVTEEETKEETPESDRDRGCFY